MEPARWCASSAMVRQSEPASPRARLQACPIGQEPITQKARTRRAFFALLHRSYRSRVPQSISLKMSHTMRMISTGCSVPIECTIFRADQAWPVRKRVNGALRVKRRSDCALRSLSIHNFHDSGNYLGHWMRKAYRRSLPWHQVRKMNGRTCPKCLQMARSASSTALSPAPAIFCDNFTPALDKASAHAALSLQYPYPPALPRPEA